MIYAPILGQPYYGLDRFLDFSNFDKLSKEVKFAITKSKSKFGLSFSGPNTPGLVTWLPDQNFLELGDARQEVSNYFESNAAEDWEKEKWNDLRFEERTFFAMLTLPAKSLGYSLSLRRINFSMFPPGNGGGFGRKHLRKYTEDTENFKDFEFLIDWIDRQNIFSEIGRAQFFINSDGHGTPIHRDYADKSYADEFIWINFFENKKFFIYDEEEKIKHYITERSAIFDNHQWHGGDPSPGIGISFRIDGIFTTEFIKKTGLTDYVKKPTSSYYRK